MVTYQKILICMLLIVDEWVWPFCIYTIYALGTNLACALFDHTLLSSIQYSINYYLFTIQLSLCIRTDAVIVVLLHIVPGSVLKVRI